MNGGLSDADRAYLERSCAESGVPVQVTDPQVLLDAADALWSGRVEIDHGELPDGRAWSLYEPARGAPNGRLAGLDVERGASGSEPVPAGVRRVAP